MRQFAVLAFGTCHARLVMLSMSRNRKCPAGPVWDRGPVINHPCGRFSADVVSDICGGSALLVQEDDVVSVNVQVSAETGSLEPFWVVGGMYTHPNLTCCSSSAS